MKLDTKPTAELLVALWKEVAELIRTGSVEQLAAKFSYGVRSDRETVAAIREDLARSLRVVEEHQLAPAGAAVLPTVIFYAPNDSHLIAAADGKLFLAPEGFMGFSLVVFGESGSYHVSLESIDAVA